MAESKSRRLAAFLRVVVLILVLGTIAFVIWRNSRAREDYTGGDVHTTGTVEAVHVQLGFKIAGRLAEVSVAEGYAVRPGQLVARLEPQDFEVQAGSAAATLEAARAALAQAHAAEVQARANRDRAAADWERTRLLVKDEAISAQQVDAFRAAAEAAAAQVQVSAAQVQAAEAQIHQAESAQKNANLQLSYTELHAPEGGIVSQQIHRPGEMVMVGAAVISLAQVDTVEVHAAVDETRIGAVRPGNRVQARVYTFDHQIFDGTVTAIEPTGDFATRKDWGAQRRDIRTFSVTAKLPNPQYLLKDGMTVDLTILVDPAVQKMVGTTP
jgi:HlyD family secretion protein